MQPPELESATEESSDQQDGSITVSEFYPVTSILKADENCPWR